MARSSASLLRLATWTVLRYGLGLLFVAAAVGKLLDIPGFAAILASYRLALPETWLAPVGLTLALVEGAIGWNLLRGRRVVLSCAGTLVFHLGYTLLTTVGLARGLSLENCGCFGVYLARPLTWMTPVEDLLLAVLSALALMVVPTPRRSGCGAVAAPTP